MKQNSCTNKFGCTTNFMHSVTGYIHHMINYNKSNHCDNHCFFRRLKNNTKTGLQHLYDELVSKYYTQRKKNSQHFS
jgi:hypothetical protein